MNENRTTDLVSYEGNVYHWETRSAGGSGRYAILCPLGGGEEIAAPMNQIRTLPGPGMRTTYNYAGSY